MSLENRQGGRWGREAVFISEYQPCTVNFYKAYFLNKEQPITMFCLCRSSKVN